MEVRDWMTINGSYKTLILKKRYSLYVNKKYIFGTDQIYPFHIYALEDLKWLS